ncbi:MAG: hypothetical protein MPK09_07780 [Gammaproteobacteria bacterium]|nr:hypothetical protein [Gammaproteobacteria bacterium]
MAKIMCKFFGGWGGCKKQGISPKTAKNRQKPRLTGIFPIPEKSPEKPGKNPGRNGKNGMRRGGLGAVFRA